MSYTPINIPVYTAAFSGALSGMGASGRILTSADSSSYSNLAQIAGAYAQEFDTLWNDATTANSFVLEAVQDLTSSSWIDRSPGTANQIEPSTHAPLCQSIIAVIVAANGYLSDQGITPTTPGGSVTFTNNGVAQFTGSSLNTMTAGQSADARTPLYFQPAGTNLQGFDSLAFAIPGFCNPNINNFTNTDTVEVQLNGGPQYWAQIDTAGNGPTEIDLPDSNNGILDIYIGMAVYVRDVTDAGGNQNVTIVPGGTDTINGVAASKVFNAAGLCVLVVYVGSGQWWTVRLQ